MIFNPQTTISFTLAQEERATIGIYDVTGERLALLADQQFAAGSHILIWSGRDARGHAVPSGTYLVRLETESGVEARKITLVL